MAAPVPVDRLPPTATAYVIATAIVAGVTGYFIGQGASLNLFSREREGWPNSYNVEVYRDSSDEEDEEDEDLEQEGNGEELASFKDNIDEVKLVLVVRMDLGMTKGTCAHLHFLCCDLFGHYRCSLLQKTTLPNDLLDAYYPASQAKSPPNVPTPHSPATNTS